MSDTKTETVKLYNVNDGVTGRDGGPYMDQVDAIQAEIQRAKVEGREPDLDNPPATAGQVLVTGSQLLLNSNAIPASKQNTSVHLQEIEAKPAGEIEVEVIEQGPVWPLSPMVDPEGEPVEYDAAKVQSDAAETETVDNPPSTKSTSTAKK